MNPLSPKSIRWKIQAWHAFLLVCAVTVLVVGFYNYESRVEVRELDAQLQSALTPLLPRILPPPHRDGPGRRDDGRRDGRERPPEHRAELLQREELVPDGFYYVAWTPEHEVHARSQNAPRVDGTILDAHASVTTFRTREDEWRELVHHMPNGYSVLVGTSTASIRAHMRQLALGLTGAGILVICIAVAGGWWLMGRAIRPIGEISATARKIAAGDLSKRIRVQDSEGELEQLAAVLNDTFDRLEKSFDQQVRFTADASHELRTPVSVILTQTQLALSRDRSPEEYRQILETCERAAERMRNLVNQLLELARVDAGEDTLVPEKCDLARVVRESLQFIDPLARKKKVTLNHSLEPLQARADVMKLGQVLINLLNNAIHHNQEGIEVSVSLKCEDEAAVIRIRDNGCGIPVEALPHLFDRFYRVDKSRSRNKGSSGLGLAICKAIVEAHGGTITVQSAPGQGAAFTIRLPLSLQRTRTFHSSSQ